VSLSSGTRIGSYTVVSPLGAGGMGEVYRAKDTKLGRDVAIKVLPVSLAADPERLARFEREARVLASLNHPHIASIYGVEDSTDVKALVLELVEGPTLQDRLDEGPIPPAEALAIARQIAEALEAAHERGIVHRDLKPANVKLDADGKVKVLDFGLAKALDPLASPSNSSPDITHSPTMSLGTQAGMILGTAAYMSPEQARGKAADKRADIWSFGVVLFEMLTGKRLFAGETVSDTLAAVLRNEISFEDLPPPAPTAVRTLLARCLERDPKNRLRDIGEARISIDAMLAAPNEPAVSDGKRPETGTRAGWIAAAAMALVAAFAGWKWLSTPATPPSPVTAFAVALPQGIGIPRSDSPVLALSRDGRTLVFAANDAKGQRLYRRSMGRVEITPIDGTEGAADPVISPDGKLVAFVAGQKLKTIPIAGGTPTILCDSPADRGIAWTPDGRIFFSPSFDTGLMQIPANGGTPAAVTKPGRDERSHRWPDVLPGGKAVLFTVGMLTSPGNYDGSPIAAVDLATGREKVLVPAARMARFVPPDRLVFQRDVKLYAVRFDPRTLTVLSAPVVVFEGVGGEVSSGAGYFSAADDGTLSFAPATALVDASQIVLVSRTGVATPLPLPSRSYHYPRFSPDGKKIAFSAGSGPSASFLGTDDDVWTYDLSSKGLNRLTFEGHDVHPVWSPDGKWIAYTSAGGPMMGVQRKASAGNGPPESVWKQSDPRIVNCWTPTGASLLVTSMGHTIGLWLVPVPRGENPSLLLSDPGGAESWAARISPDGRYIAYTSFASGNNIVFAETYPPGAGKWQVSPEDGMMPVWGKDGRELFYLQGDRMMAIDVRTESTFSAGPPRVLFSGSYDTRTAPVDNFDVSPDGQTFLMIRREGVSQAASQIDVLLHFGATLRAAAPGVR
jgi:Tol biopolymer transport system component